MKLSAASLFLALVGAAAASDEEVSTVQYAIEHGLVLL